MYEGHSSVHSNTNTVDDDDEQLLTLTTFDSQHETILINTLNESVVDINSTNEEKLYKKPVLDEIQVEPPVTDTFRCSNIYARYIIAAWAFFGFFCLFAM
ncbi:unnamed protein product [Rotaria sordida]|uniref:Uncharacterized protein n=1 Tax=Rotaria sordida TaxID=392033 RepID=A0A815HI38_9BILA|nr:unnamed protein product [Rotaria sordida]CAF1602608.1 unnamed protein product [Rotaria sordida]